MTERVPVEPTVQEIPGFHWDEVPQDRKQRQRLRKLVVADKGAIARFSGTFKGNGLNTIFRPQDFAVSPTALPNPASGPNDNILELNPTEEILSFSAPLGNIPNRGMVQGDITLNGIPYLQTINDVADPENPIGIHFEPGIWLSIPQTTVPNEPMMYARMASIPHGTTIEAQGFSFSVKGGPFIAPVDITPFVVGDPTNLIKFPSQVLSDTGTFRLPQDLTDLDIAGTITQPILDNPNIILDVRAKAQNITETIVIAISTDPTDPFFNNFAPLIPAPPGSGGGTDNVAFLLGNTSATPPTPNANAVQMNAIFWIETVQETIEVPTPSPDGLPVIVPGDTSAGNPVVSFAVSSAVGTAAGTQIDVTYTQIQYTQTVFLNFNGLTWPHVSVATLVPNDPIPV